jgi:hypothetical protein
MALVCCLTVVRTVLQLDSLRPEEIALMQFDSRPLTPHTYWYAAYVYNHIYCREHGHRYIYYSLRNEDTCNNNGNELASPWCKVRAMLQATEDYPEVKLFVYMDSDAVIDSSYLNTSVNQMLTVIQSKLQVWDPEQKPVIFNQDGPSWWCRLIDRAGYSMCLNAGTVLWYRNAFAVDVLERWWKSSLDAELEDNPIKR